MQFSKKRLMLTAALAVCAGSISFSGALAQDDGPPDTGWPPTQQCVDECYQNYQNNPSFPYGECVRYCYNKYPPP